jgi:hypothetical protein
MSDSKFYLDHIHASASGYRATWHPGIKLNIGDIIKLDKHGVCNVFSNLKAEGITPTIRSSHATSNKEYNYGSGLEITKKLSGSIPKAGSVLAKGDAGFNIQFKSGKNLIFKISGYTEEMIDNLGILKSAILQKYKSGTWDKDLLVVTHLTTADSATIIISEQGNCAIDIKAAAQVNAGPFEITNASLGLQFVNTKNTSTNILAEKGITPLYKAMGIVSNWYGKKDLDTRDIDFGSEAEEKTEEYVFAEI